MIAATFALVTLATLASLLAGEAIPIVLAVLSVYVWLLAFADDCERDGEQVGAGADRDLPPVGAPYRPN